MGSTADAAFGRSSVLAGVRPNVRPKKMHSAFPGGQNAISPTSISSRPTLP
jgi:hypothetical protein